MARFLPYFSLLMCLVSTALSQEASQTPVQLPPESIANLLIRKVPPVYPPLARQARIQGTVVLNVIINKSGEVRDVQLYSGHPMLSPSAIQAVKQWKYQPYLQDGEPIEVQTTVQVNFKLADNPAAKNIAGDAPGGLPPGAIGSVRQRVRVSRGVMAGLVINKVPPEYPPDAKDQHIQGVVVLNVNIDKEGNVYQVQLISGHPLLAPAAMDAVRQWKYRGYVLNGEPVEVETQVMVNFTLADN